MFTDIDFMAVRDRNEQTLREVRANRLGRKLRAADANHPARLRKSENTFFERTTVSPERR